MAKCDLVVELDEPDRVYHSEETVQGKVHVDVDSDVKCSGLVISCGWKTHGRGNVAMGKADEETVFSGVWTGGNTYQYRFSLPAASWPPTYHGKMLSIDHYIEARAKIPWAFDPKAATPFMVEANRVPDVVASATRHAHAKTRIPKFAGGLIIAVFVGAQLFFMGAIGVAIMLLISTVAFTLWFIRRFLPRYLLGQPDAFLESDTLTRGSEVAGEFVTTTRKTVNITAIRAVLRATEVCISGHGSNKKTHRKVVYESKQELQPNVTLQAGQESRCPFSFQLPEDAACSVSLDDNSLIWTVDLRVDIPRWPDWTKSIPLFIVPADFRNGGVQLASGSGSMSSVHHEGSTTDDETVVNQEKSETAELGELTFAETVDQLWAVRSDRDQVEMVVEAVIGISFEITAKIERRLLYAGDQDPHVHADGYAVWAIYPNPGLPLVLYVPHELGDEFEQIGRGVWTGKGVVVGWDSLHGRLQIKLDSTL